MEPTITMSLKDYNKLIYNNNDKRIVEALNVIVDCVVRSKYVAENCELHFDAIKTMQNIIKYIQNEECSLEETIEILKNKVSI